MIDDAPETLLHQPAGEVVVTTLRVEVVDGPDRGKVSVTGEDVISVGTARNNSAAVSDFTVSRYHLELAARAGGILVTDLGSTNGTYAGGIRIERAIVPPGTLLQLGGTTIRVDDAARRTVAVQGGAHQLVGLRARSIEMLRLFGDVERIAPAASSVLVIGESGTGKERVAEALHARSPRKDAPFVTVDCGALPSALLASELFGHERGAFTGAERTHPGAFERAGKGTLFLDEIGELPAVDQASLLGVLERKRFRRVGGTTELELGARVIAATNRDLRAEVNNGRFRPDLYHRLAVVSLRIPPLRDRRDDVPLLVEHFAREFGADGTIEQLFGADLLARWQRHPWPGNVRELRNAIEAALLVGISAGDAVVSSEIGVPPYKDARARLLGDFERDYLSRLLAEAGGNVSAAARLAKMDRSHLIDLLRRHGIKG